MNAEYIIENIDFASRTWVFVFPLILMVLDFATGILNAYKRNEIKSSKMREGLIKKFGELVILIIGELIVFGTNIPAKNEIMSFLSIYISVMELISITENLVLLGVPLPAFSVKALHVTAEALDGTEEKGD